MFKHAGGRKVLVNDLTRVISTMSSPPEVIIDGLFGYLQSLDDLWDDEDKSTCAQLIKWANSNRARRISIDKPSFAEERMSVDWVIQVGAVKEDTFISKDVRTFIVDVGIGKNVWKDVGVALNTGKKRKGDLGIGWEGKWVVEIENIA